MQIDDISQAGNPLHFKHNCSLVKNVSPTLIHYLPVVYVNIYTKSNKVKNISAALINIHRSVLHKIHPTEIVVLQNNMVNVLDIDIWV